MNHEPVCEFPSEFDIVPELQQPSGLRSAAIFRDLIMCGITGILSKTASPVPGGVIEAMTRRLAHRGPDGEGIYKWPGGAVGHRRLTIIDPETGAQPMSSDDGRVHITYNGEIYNYRTLRSTLEGIGHRFRTRSDTEVVLSAYREWGRDCVRRFRGMFAFVVVDEDRNEIFLARDHLGIKPLVYLNTPDVFAFASEIQALRAVPDINLDIDVGAIDTYLQLLYIPAPETVYRSVFKLPPGHTMIVTFDGVTKTPQEYWRPRFAVDESKTAEQWVEGLEDVLRESVRAHLVSDVPFGAFLSGGLDSTAIVMMMSEILDRPVKAFTIGFEEKVFDERPWAIEAAETCGVEHHVEILRPEALEILPDLVRHYGEPFGDSSAIPTYYLSKLAASHVPMVLSGDGGDELLAGYHSYRGWMRWLTWHGRPRWRKTLYPLAHALRPNRYLLRQPGADSWARCIETTTGAIRKSLWRPGVDPHGPGAPQAFVEAFAEEPDLDPLKAAQYCDFRTYLPSDILAKVDIASMMNSLEVRTPLVDHVVVDYAGAIPSRFNMTTTPGNEFKGKQLLKRILAKKFDDRFLNRPKQGFGVPVAKWFRTSDKNTIHERLTDQGSPLLEFFEPKTVRTLAFAHPSGLQWQLLFLDEWLRQNNSL